MDYNSDIQVVEETSVDAETLEMRAKAAEVAETLVRHYPDHIWAVGWAPGMTLVVKNLAIPGQYGYTIDATKSFSASDLAHMAMLAGGELLERCGFDRGRWNGEFATKVDTST